MATTDFPILNEWLTRHHARPLWADDINSNLRVEGWKVNGHAIVITMFKGGWNIYTAHPDNNVMEALVDAEQRLGLKIGGQ